MAVVRLRSMILRMLTGNATLALSQFLIVVVIAKFEGAEVLGSYALAQAVVSPVFAFANMGLRSAIASDTQYEFHPRTYLKLWLYTAVFAVFVSWLIASVIKLNDLSYILVFAVIIGRLSESLSFVCYGFFQRLESVKQVSQSCMLRGIFGFVSMFSIVLIWREIEYAIYAAFISWLAVLFLFDLPALIRLKVNPLNIDNTVSDNQFELLIKKVFPLGMLTLFTAITQHAPRFFIEYMLGTAYVGYFAAIVQLANVGALLINAMSHTLITRLSRLFKENSVAYIKLLWKAIFLASLVGLSGFLVSLIFGEQILRLLYTKEFSDFNHALVLSMIWAGMLFISTTLGVGLIGARLFKLQANIGGSALFIMIPSCYFFIDMYGINGAFMALILGVTVRSMLQVFYIRKIVSNKM